jgi:hypothetical protein
VVFEALIFPLIDYCSIAYGFTYKTHVNRIQVLIRRATIITFSGFTASRVPLFSTIKLEIIRIKTENFLSKINF